MKKILFSISALFFSSFAFAQEREGLIFTESEAIEIALKNNSQIAELKLGIQASNFQLKSQESMFPWVLNADAGIRYDEQPTIDVIQSGTRKSLAFQGGIEILKQFTIGTQFSARFDINRVSSEVPFSLPDLNINEIRKIGPNFGSTLNVKINQPLLRGFGTDYYTAPIESGKQQVTIATLTLHQNATRLMGEVHRAYWNWVKAEWEFDAAKRRMERTQWLQKATDAQIQAGTLAALEHDIVEQQAAVAEQSILAAELGIEDAKDALAELLGDFKMGNRRPPKIVNIPSILSLADSLKRAIKTSPELAMVNEDVRASKISRLKFENDKKAKLDALASFTQAGLSEEIGTTLTQIGRVDFTSLFIGLSFSMPLDNEIAEYKIEAVNTQILKAKFNKKTIEDAIRTQVKKAHRFINMQQKRASLSEKEIRLAKKNLKSIQEKFAVGQASRLEVLQVEENFQDAELRNQKTKIDLILSAIALEQLDGSLLNSFVESASK